MTDVPTTAELLNEVNIAIRKVMRGQSYTIDGQTVTRANLGELRSWRDQLRQELAAESGESTGVMYPRFE